MDKENEVLENSVGVVCPKVFKYSRSFEFVSGAVIEGFELVYETYGKLNSDRSNAVLVCHALSGNHHAAGYYSPSDKKPGWWDSAIGPNKPIDTNNFFVVSVNNLGGCDGSTGPGSVDPKSNQCYGFTFPIVTVIDWVRSQALLTLHLGVEQWCAVVGGSLGGMQALQWAIDYPDKIRHAVVIASAAKLSAQNIAFNEVARQAIKADLDFCDGAYRAQNKIPRHGLRLARMLGHITYLSDEGMGSKFGRDLYDDKLKYNFESEFQIESYLRYQGDKFASSFDANTYLLMTKALDYFDPAAEFSGSLSHALSHVSTKFLVISFSSDWRFSPRRSKEIVNALIHEKKQVTYVEIDTQHGHDSFLMSIPDYFKVFSAYMDQLEIGGRV